MKRILKKVLNVCRNKYVLLALIAGAVFSIILMVNFTKNDKDVEYRVLSDSEIPQEIQSQVVPEYRDLERALACVIDEKIYVIVTRGEKPTSGYELSISDIMIEKEEGLENLIVNAKFKDPEPGGSLAQVLTYPVQIAETNLAELPDSIELHVKY